MAMVDNAYVLFSRLCVELIYALPLFRSPETHGDFTTFEGHFLSKCRFELENSSPPLVYVEESNCCKFVKTVRILAEVFKNKMVTDPTRQSIIQVLMIPIFPPERNTVAMNLFLSSIGKLAESFKQQLVHSSQATQIESKNNEEVRLRKEAVDPLARKNEELEMLKPQLESYKEEQGKLQLQTQALEQNHQEGLRLRKETEYALAIERERIEQVKLQLQNLGDEVDSVCLKNEELESKYKGEAILRKKSEIALERKRKELEEIKQLLETNKIEQENMTSQVRTLQDKHNSMREERDITLKSVQELTMKQSKKRELPSSFYCPITQEVMKEPHVTADGYT